MKRILSLALALVFLLALAPAVTADVIWVPEDPFLEDHMSQSSHHERNYYTAGPNGSVTVYKSPESAAVVKQLPNGELLNISWIYTDPDGISWGFCEFFGDEGWDGWMPMDYLLLRYDSQSFREEFADRIEDGFGQIAPSGEDRVHFWGYPGSDTLRAAMLIDESYQPQYLSTFVDDAGRNWGHINYYAGIRDVWVCLDAPTADYDTLYAQHPPQQVTHPTRDGAPAEIKPAGPDMSMVLLAACAVAVLSGGFLWLTRKKKSHHE